MILIVRCGAILRRDKLRLDYLGGVLVKSTFWNDMWIAWAIASLFPDEGAKKG